MKADTIEDVIADAMAEHATRLRAYLVEEIARLVAAKPLPPFVPPPVWAEGRHPAGTVVRHHNGLFSARRDTTDEPPGEAWLPLLVGIAAVDFKWTDDRRMVLRVDLSDGTVVETERDFVLPIARGFWKAETDYREGDRVLRFGDWQATKASKGIDPNGAANEGQWIKVTGRTGPREISFTLDDEGRMFESGREIGTIKPVVSTVLRTLFEARR